MLARGKAPLRAWWFISINIIILCDQHRHCNCPRRSRRDGVLHAQTPVRQTKEAMKQLLHLCTLPLPGSSRSFVKAPFSQSSILTLQRPPLDRNRAQMLDGHHFVATRGLVKTHRIKANQPGMSRTKVKTNQHHQPRLRCSCKASMQPVANRHFTALISKVSAARATSAVSTARVLLPGPQQ